MFIPAVPPKLHVNAALFMTTCIAFMVYLSSLTGMRRGLLTSFGPRVVVVNGSAAACLTRLNYLAPNIIAAILDGKQPVDLTANKLMVDTRFPFDWRAQRAALGFA